MSRLLLKLQGEQYQALTKHIESVRRARHDLRQHLTVISAMAAQGDCEAVQSYAAHLTPTEAAPLTLCEHPVCNALLCHYQTLAQREGVAFETQASLPRDLRIEESDLAVVLGNLLENALEANRYVPQKERQISVRATTQGSRLFLIVSNPCDAQERSDKGTRSRKRAYEEPGVGLSSVEAVVKRYHGDWKIDRQDGRFTVSVMLEGNGN
ncbi:MAG: ATP-binding protein [Eubacteriales bacterium]|nr:ATP-binding protein [Eubacteriales bacterium]